MTDFFTVMFLSSEAHFKAQTKLFTVAESLYHFQFRPLSCVISAVVVKYPYIGRAFLSPDVYLCAAVIRDGL